MGLKFSPNNTSGGRLRFTVNQPGLMSSAYTVDWDNVTGLPADLNDYLDFATNAEAAAGVSTDTVMSPATTLVAIQGQGSVLFATRAAAAAAAIPSTVSVLMTGGYATAGDGGGARYVRTGSAPSHQGYFQSADGAYWLIDVAELDPRQFGVILGTTDYTTQIQYWLDAADSLGVPCVMPPGRIVGSGIVNGDGQIIRGIGRDPTFQGLSASEWRAPSTTADILTILGHGCLVDSINFPGTGPRAALAGAEQGRAIVIGASTTLTNVTAAGSTMSDLAAVFTADDVGKYVTIYGAGAAGASHSTTIASRNSATSVQLTAAVTTNVAGETAYYGDLTTGTTLQNLTIASHSIGVHRIAGVKGAYQSLICNGYHAMKLECRPASDAGDEAWFGGTYTADSTGGANFWLLSGGGPRFSNVKGLTCQDHFRVDWSHGLSGGPRVHGGSFENTTRSFMRVTGDGTAAINGLHVDSAWIVGGTAQIYFDDTIPVDDLVITNNSIHNGSAAATGLVRIGAVCTDVDVSGNMIDGEAVASAVGIVVASGATGQVRFNDIVDVTTKVSNSSTGVTLYEANLDGMVWTVPGNPLQAINRNGTALEQVFRFEGDSPSPAANDQIYGSFFLSNGSGTQFEYGRITVTASNVTAGAEGGSFIFSVPSSGSLAGRLFLNAAQLSPLTDAGISLGGTTLAWNGLHLNTGTAVNWENGNVTLTHSTDALALSKLLDISGASAGQIKFPATQNASSDVNTLDDYEEGTWTPVLTFSTPGNLAVTYSTQVGSYTKIGNVCRLTCNIATSAFTHTTASGNARITGLPFTSANVTGNLFGSMAGMSGWTKANYTETLFFIANNSALAVIGAYGSGQAEANITATDMPTGGTVIIRSTVMYQI